SEKRSGYAFPMSHVSWRQISSANLGFAFPEKILMPPVVPIAFARDKNWLGRVDSNQRMPVPKTGALPLGYAPVSVYLFAVLRERKSGNPDEFNASKYSSRESVSQEKTFHPASHLRLSRACCRATSSSKTPNTLEPLPANKAPRAPVSSNATVTRSISGSISKITPSKSLRRGHCPLPAENRSARELERIEADSEVVKERAFRAA